MIKLEMLNDLKCLTCSLRILLFLLPTLLITLELEHR